MYRVNGLLTGMFLAAALGLTSSPATATPGQPDATFGIGGSVVTDLGNGTSIGKRVLQLSTGKLLVGGTCNYNAGPFDTGSAFCLVRYNANGAVDSTFGANGIVRQSIATSRDVLEDMAVQPDGKIVAVGACFINSSLPQVIPSRNRICIARFSANGVLDTTFNQVGYTIVAVNPVTTERDDLGKSVAVLPDGKLLVTGQCAREIAGTTPVQIGGDFCIVKLTSSGIVDTTFSTDGFVRTTFLELDSPTKLLLLAGGKFVVGGYCIVLDASGSAVSQFCLARYNADGALDLTFGVGGKTRTSIAGRDSQGSGNLALQADGKILHAGTCTSTVGSVRYTPCVFRYTADGLVDVSFGARGHIELPTYTSLRNHVAVQVDGKIVVAGRRNSYVFVARYTSTGLLDRTFNGLGSIALRLGSGDNDSFSDLVIQSDKKIVTAGFCRAGTTGSDERCCLARLVSDDVPMANCALDYDGDNQLTEIDVAIHARLAMGFKGSAVTAGLTGVLLPATARAYDVDGNGRGTATVDSTIFSGIVDQKGAVLLAPVKSFPLGATRTTVSALRAHIFSLCDVTIPLD
jgi:uncharacterized delta-60 repeat protein